MSRIPLFPLDLVLFPNVPLPLHIFEERYRELINRCIEEEIPFGVVYHRGESIKEIGCSAIIERVIKRYDDGRMDILAVGGERFTIEKLDDTGLYLEAEVRYLEEPFESDAEEAVNLAIAELLKYAYYAEIELDRERLEALTGNQLSFLVAGIDLVGLDTKQELLETDDLEERLRLGVAELARANNRLAAAARVKKALGNEVDLNSFLN
jgi:Lon protease-like protein